MASLTFAASREGETLTPVPDGEGTLVDFRQNSDPKATAQDGSGVALVEVEPDTPIPCEEPAGAIGDAEMGAIVEIRLAGSGKTPPCP